MLIHHYLPKTPQASHTMVSLVGECSLPHSWHTQEAAGDPWTKRRHSQWYTISFTSVADILLFSFFILFCILRSMQKMGSSCLPDIAEQVPDIDPDDQLVPLLLLLLDLLLDDPEDGCILPSAGCRGIVDIAALEG